jgi:hypothetical protein
VLGWMIWQVMQLRDGLALTTKTMPGWCQQTLDLCPFLFPLKVRCSAATEGITWSGWVKADVCGAPSGTSGVAVLHCVRCGEGHSPP